MDFGEILYALRKKLGLTQDEVAKQIGIKKNTISNYENNVSKPQYEQLVKLCNLFKCNPNVLMSSDLVGLDMESNLNPDDQAILDKYNALTAHDREIVDYILNMENTSDLSEPIQVQEVTKIIYKLPVYQQDVAAGSGQLGFDQKHHMEEFSEIDMPKKVSYGIKISGTSMVTDDENSIPDGSTVLVTTDFDTDELIGEAVIVNIGGVLVCKEYNIAEDGHLWLKSRNSNKSNEDRHIYNIDRIRIIGKVVKAITPS